MAIKNKDGTVFRLSRPNPIMSEQSIWSNSEKLLVHNQLGTRVKFSKDLQPLTQPIEEEENFFETKPKQTIMAVPSVEPQTIDKLPKNVDPDEIEKYKIKVWCFPAYEEKKRDPLYGETVTRIKYGEKFLFEALIDEQSDFGLGLWATTNQITPQSVIFPRNYDKRWWRVVQCSPDKESPGLYYIAASVTDFQPSFT